MPSLATWPVPDTLTTQRVGPGFRALHWSVPVSVGLFVTSEGRADAASEDSVINVLFEGAYRVRSAHGDGLVDPNRWVFYDRGAAYQSVPLDARPRRGAYVRLHPSVVGQVLDELAPDRAEPGFPCTTAPMRADHLRRWHHLLHRARRGASDGLEEDLLGVCADILQGALPVRAPVRSRRDAVVAVQERLAARPTETASLAELGADVGLSAFQLARAFRDHLGTSVHQYRDQLRLNVGAARLADSPDLATLALGLGYASHSHFTARFRRRFGCAPSRFSDDGRDTSARHVSACP